MELNIQKEQEAKIATEIARQVNNQIIAKQSKEKISKQQMD